MNSQSAVSCPKCGVMLPTGGLAAGVSVQCAGCGHQFTLQSEAGGQPTNSGKAVASLVLGLIPIPLITGIPAVILGIWALFDIKRRTGELKGGGMAVAGICLGGACTFLCTPLLVAMTWFTVRVAEQSKLTEDPEQAAAIGRGIAQFDIPEGLEPRMGLDTGFIGMKMAVYGDKSETSMLMLMQFPPYMAGSKQQMEMQMRQQMRGQQMNFDVERTEQLTFTIRNQPTAVTEAFGKYRETGSRARQYTAVIPSDSGLIMVILATQDPPAEAAPAAADQPPHVRLTEEQVRQFFESFQ